MFLDVNPESKYGFIAESLRQSFPEAKTCSMFCGGKKCKYCDPEASPIWNKDQKVIEGLYSNWCVTLLAYVDGKYFVKGLISRLFLYILIIFLLTLSP